MTLLMLKKYIKFKYIAIITIMLIVIIASDYFFTYKEITALLEASNSVDTNPESINQIRNSFNGLTYFFKFLLSSDNIVIFTLIFSIASVSLFGYNLIYDISSGRGNFIVSRVSYKKYISSTLIAQTLFNYMYLMIFFVVVFVFSYLALGNLNIDNGVFTGYLMKLNSDRLIVYFGVACIKIFSLASLINLITITSSMIYILIKNKYIVQLFPLIYYFSALFLVNAISNIIPQFTMLLSSFVIDAQIFNIMEMGLIEGHSKLLQIFIFVIVLGSIDFIMYQININKFGKDYIL